MAKYGAVSERQHERALGIYRSLDAKTMRRGNNPAAEQVSESMCWDYGAM